MTSAFPSQRLKIRFLPAVPGTDAKGSSIAAKFWYDQAKIQADIALQANETKVDKAGSVMTGPLTLFGDPTSPLHASTKQYADTKVARSGDSMSGFLTLSADPTATLHAATKSYADSKVAKSGDTMSGTLVLSGPPVGPNDAATKQYADGAVSIVGGNLFQPKDPDLSSIAAGTTSGTFYFRRGDGDWAPVVIGDGLSFDTITGDFESVGGGGGGGTGDVSASDGPVANQLAMWIGSVTIKGINIGSGLQLTTVGSTQSLTAIGTVKINGTPTPGQYATWFDSSTIQGTNLDGDLAALAGLTGTHTIYFRSAADTWSPVVIGGGLTFVGDTLAAIGSITIAPPTPVAGQTAKWASATSLKAVNVYTTAGTAPATPDPGNFWYDTSTGVLAVNVDDGNSQQWLQVAPGAGNIASNETFVKVRTFNSDTVYVPTPGTQFIQVECIGAGGSGGAASSGSGSTSYQGGGGGGGGYSRSVFTAAQIGPSQPLQIGAGGQPIFNTIGNAGGRTTFGAGLCFANGGNGGIYADNAHNPVGAAGGGAGLGDFAVAGAWGGWGYTGNVQPADRAFAGNGAPGPFGGGSSTPVSGGPVQGTAGNGYGAGGAGGNSYQATGNVSGGAGSPGVIIITEFNIGVGQQGPQGLAGGVTTPLTPQGRLTYASGQAVMTATTVGVTIYYTPYCGNQIPIWSGSSWTTMSFNELSAVNTDTTKSPAAIGASKLNDWYVWNDAGTLRLSHGPDWASDTARAATLTRLQGLWVNTAAITNGPGVNLGTYVGTTRSDGNSNFNWLIGGTAVNGTSTYLSLFNAYNRVQITASSYDSTSSWVDTTAAMKMLNGSSFNRFQWVDGLKEVAVTMALQTYATAGAGIGWGINSVTVLHNSMLAIGPSSATAGNSTTTHTDVFTPLLGFTFLQALQGSFAQPTTFYGTGTSLQTTGFTGTLMM